MSENSKKPLSREPYKGTRDFYPEDWSLEKYLFDTMRKVVESYGYVEYNASPIEPAELYAAKTGEEIVTEQTYTFKDRGDREVTLRPEMTPTLARMIAGRKRELPYPLRWYSIANIFRYENPQRGRLREHYQLNVDLFGIKGVEAEIELITIAYQIMQALGAKDNDFEIRVNSRKQLQEYLKGKLHNEDMLGEALRLLDKREKMSKEEFDKNWQAIAKDPLDEKLEKSEEVKNLVEKLKNSGVNNVVYYPTLVRGFDYYTDIVFEVFDKNPENRRALFGGGRFDELLNIFDEETVPAVGFGMGDVTARDFLETHNLLPKYIPTTKLYICIIEEKNADFASGTAAKLRQKGVNVALDFSYRKVGDQIKSADKQKIPFVFCIGDEEEDSNTFTLKELTSGKEEKLSVTEIVDKLKS